MVSMKETKCPKCGGVVFKLAGKAAKLCHDECLDCRKRPGIHAGETHAHYDEERRLQHIAFMGGEGDEILD